MKYDVFIEKAALKKLSKIPPKEQSRIITTIKALAEEPRPIGVIKVNRQRSLAYPRW